MFGSLYALQGVGKTTACAKLALYLQKQKKSVLLVATDVYRPAAIDQLQKLGQVCVCVCVCVCHLIATDVVSRATYANVVRLADGSKEDTAAL